MLYSTISVLKTTMPYQTSNKRRWVKKGTYYDLLDNDSRCKLLDFNQDYRKLRKIKDAIVIAQGSDWWH